MEAREKILEPTSSGFFLLPLIRIDAQPECRVEEEDVVHIGLRGIANFNRAARNLIERKCKLKKVEQPAKF